MIVQPNDVSSPPSLSPRTVAQDYILRSSGKEAYLTINDILKRRQHMDCMPKLNMNTFRVLGKDLCHHDAADDTDNGWDPTILPWAQMNFGKLPFLAQLPILPAPLTGSIFPTGFPFCLWKPSPILWWLKFLPHHCRGKSFICIYIYCISIVR